MGKWETTKQTTPVLSPATEETIATVPIADEPTIRAALASAKRAQFEWGRRTGVERGAVLRQWASLVGQNRERLAQLLSQEEGKPINEARGEIDFGNSWFQQEVFGPVVPVMEFSDFEQGLGYANDSRYGLAAYLFSNDVNRIMRAIRDLEFGELYINRGPGESIHAFHGGWKQSGAGGDDGRHGLEHYLQKKTVYLRVRA
jgi:acyl-CoA reductase-like NAD-dependent aldehyde dehydrogenase